MTEYIDREAAIEAFRKKLCAVYNDRNECLKREYATGFTGIRNVLLGLPAANVREVVRAVWRRYSPFTDTYECSNCGEQVIDQQFRTNFCPNCGAEMVKGETDG